MTVVIHHGASAAPRAADDRNMIYDRAQSSAFTFVNVISVIMRFGHGRLSGIRGPFETPGLRRAIKNATMSRFSVTHYLGK